MTGEIKLGGTGFLVSHEEDGYGFGYLVTARHVAKKVRPQGDVVVRVNKKGEDAVNFTVKDIYWAYHTDETVDVAVTPTFGLINQNEFDVAYYNLADLVRPSAAPFGGLRSGRTIGPRPDLPQSPDVERHPVLPQLQDRLADVNRRLVKAVGMEIQPRLL